MNMNLHNEFSKKKKIQIALENKRQVISTVFLELYPYKQARFLKKQKNDSRLLSFT